MLTVEKIGGTSMSALHQVIDNIILYNKNGSAVYNRVFVVSAFSGITNVLLENKKTKAPGVYQKLANGDDYKAELSIVAGQLRELNKQYEYLGLDVAAADKFVVADIVAAVVAVAGASRDPTATGPEPRRPPARPAG